MVVIRAKYGLMGTELEIMENIEITLDDEFRVVEISESHRDEKECTVLMPSFYNAHSHAGDFGLRGVKPSSLEELVGPTGLKVRYLNSISSHKLKQNLQQFNHESYILGVGGYNDFREGGYQGILPYLESNVLKKKLFKAPHHGQTSPFELWDKKNELLHQFLNNHQPIVQILGRPKTVEETNLVLTYGGLGIRDVRYFDEQDLITVCRLAAKKNRQIHIHAGEDPDLTDEWKTTHGESDIEWSVKNLDPDVIVHGNHGEESDFEFLLEKKIGLVLCPRSNIFTRTNLHPYKIIADLNYDPLLFGLGSDNAMFHPSNMWKEMKALFDNSKFSSKEILQIATIGGASISGVSNWEISEGNIFTGNKFLFTRDLDRKKLYTELIFKGRNAGIMHLTS